MDIKTILEMIKMRIEQYSPIPNEYLVSKGNHNGFELLVPKVIDDIKKDVSCLEMKVHLGHHFPDIDLILDNVRYGIELKSRNNGKWDTNGNSVFESISTESYEEIYVFFGTHDSKTPEFKIRYAPYWQVTSSIIVTHSPRFKINMDTQKSVFATSEEYNNLRDQTEEEKIIFLQNYLKHNTDGTKWFIAPEKNIIKPILLNELPSEVKNKVLAEVLVLYPQDLLRSNESIRDKYTRSSEYLILNYFYYSNSFRDFFSAGGKWKYSGVEFPQVVKKIFQNKSIILEILEHANENFKELAYESWRELNLELENQSFLTDYLIVLDSLSEEMFSQHEKVTETIKLSEFFLNKL